jgi:hypothetical protein
MQPRDDWRRQIYRASKLDEYRAYLSGEMYDGSEYTAEEFIKRMTAHAESPAMAAGTAVHALIENAQFGEIKAHSDAHGWHVHFDLDADAAIPEAREVPLQRTHKGITLFGRCDAISTRAVHDIKTTSAIDIDRYLDSYQWRAYLWMSGRQRFHYDIFRVKVEDDIKVVTVLEYVPLKLSAYPNLDRDVERLLEEFDACIRSLAIPEIMQRQMAA